ncbi:helicase-associated domain-containing protein [Microbacterium sp.]|uniref:helicase-associated domain-containing protein n=1 Tax=Microbacterium sp. TaxID=51671 RepID=UPI002C1E6EA9|nr:helicase-associated domain-containing protein [Microbacterium sp.]HWL77784.1 helicase-associated domain-containing protein [Microbacterium sp.]
MLSDERALATRLASLDDARLAGTLAARGISPSVSWQGFFDAAAALLDPASVDRALMRLPRETLRELRDGRATGEDARRLALVDETGAPFAAVRERLDAAAADDAAAFEPVAAPEAPEASEADAAAAAERAFTNLGALADVLLASSAIALSRTGSGSVSAVDRRRLIEAGAVLDADELDDLVTAAAAAGLLHADGRDWVVSEAGEAWLEASTPERWTTLVRGIRDSLPPALRTATGGVSPVSSWPGAFPLDPAWPDRAASLRRVMVRFGLLTPTGAEPAWTRRLREDGRVDASGLESLLPAEIDRIYLQADLTAIAPGPLAPRLDLRLRRIAKRESRAQASSYRFSADSIGAGMTEGESAESIREFLAGISLTGIPQPLEYLIESTAARHGLVRVAEDAASGGTRVTSTDDSILDAIEIDQALRPLGLIADGGDLVSRVSRDAVYWALADARYPVVAIGDDGEAESMHRRATGPRTAETTPETLYAGLISTLRAGSSADSESAWLARELELAVRARATVVVVVRMPDGSERTFTLEASGLGGGRLRGRDRGADIERTLPVSSIVSVSRG